MKLFSVRLITYLGSIRMLTDQMELLGHNCDF